VDQQRSKHSGIIRSAPDADRSPNGAGTKPDKDANANGSGLKGETQSIHPSEPSPARDESSLSTASSPGDKILLSTSMRNKSKYSESAPRSSRPTTSSRGRVPLFSSQLTRKTRNILAELRSTVVSKGPLTGRKCLITGGTSGIGKNVSFQTSYALGVWTSLITVHRICNCQTLLTGRRSECGQRFERCHKDLGSLQKHKARVESGQAALLFHPRGYH
jgi:hypothetical protein